MVHFKFPDHTPNTFVCFRYFYVWASSKFRAPPLSRLCAPSCKSPRQVHVMVITGVLTKNWEERADDRTQEKSRPRAVSLLHKRSANKTRSGLSLTTWRTPRAGEAGGGDSNLHNLFLDAFGNFCQNYRCILTQQFHFQECIYMRILLTLTCGWRNECLRLFMAVLFPKPASYKQSICPSLGAWLKESWYSHTVKYHKAGKKE